MANKPDIMKGSLFLALVVGLTVTGCSKPTPAARAPVTAPVVASTSSVAVPSSTPPVPAVTATAAAPTPTTATPAAATTASAAPATAGIAVPNGVGMNYQAAQDLWRAAGLHVLPATDATGAHRLPIIDSNWVVLAQDLKAGSSVPRNSFITATVKKYTDN